MTLDTSGILAALNRRDPDYQRTRSVLLGDPGPYLLPEGILAEVAYMVERDLGSQVLDGFLREVQEGGYTLTSSQPDIPRIRVLAARYASLPLGFADAAVVACAERHGGRVLTLDMRHFSVVANDARLSLVPGW